MVLFDELGLAERSKKNPLKVLHSKLEYKEKRKGISFVGISNYSLDAAKINRALVLSVPDLDQRLDEIIETSNNIVESISEKLIKDPIFEILSNTYFYYKEELQFIKELVVYKKYKSEKAKMSATEKLTNTPPISTEKLTNITPLSTEMQTNNTLLSMENPTNINTQESLVSANIDIEDNTKKNESNKDMSESESEILTQNDQMQKKQLNSKTKENETSPNEEREKRQFESIKKEKEFIALLKKEDKIKKDFHGNRDFYNLIKGIVLDLENF
jgi:hypothetical protein